MHNFSSLIERFVHRTPDRTVNQPCRPKKVIEITLLVHFYQSLFPSFYIFRNTSQTLKTLEIAKGDNFVSGWFSTIPLLTKNPTIVNYKLRVRSRSDIIEGLRFLCAGVPVVIFYVTLTEAQNFIVTAPQPLCSPSWGHHNRIDLQATDIKDTARIYLPLNSSNSLSVQNLAVIDLIKQLSGIQMIWYVITG